MKEGCKGDGREDWCGCIMLMAAHLDQEVVVF